MPYFIVLPLYLLALSVTLVAWLGCLLIPKLRRASAYLLAGALGSIPGIFGANLLLFLILAPIVKGNAAIPESMRWIARLFVGAGVLIGPFVVSAAGVFVGAAIACMLVLRHRRRFSA